MIRAGDAVLHPHWGRGEVKAVLDGGRRCRVDFEKAPGLFRLISPEHLQVVPAADREAAPRVDLPPTDLRQSLEALRLGVVPAAGLEALTVGRDAHLEAMDRLMEAWRGMLLLSGGYGTGKTHLIEAAENKGFAANMLVARATFDPVEVPPSHPLRLYRALASSLRYPSSSGQGLQPLLEKLSGSWAHRTARGASAHRYLTPAAWSMEHGDHILVEDMVAYVEGKLPQVNRELTGDLKGFGWPGKPLLALPDYRTFGQIMAYLLGGLATWSRDAGYNGLLVLLDEAEYLDQLGSTSREMATNVIKYLAAGSLDRDELAFNPEHLYRGGQRVHREQPSVFREDQPLAVICAFTPHPETTAALQGIVSQTDRTVEIPPISLDQLGSFADQILQFYKAVYPEVTPPEPHAMRVRGCVTGGFRRGDISNMRQAARLLVEFWDIYRRDPERALAALET